MIYFLDMDGTVCESKQVISQEMLDKLNSLEKVIVISGASREQMDLQLKGLNCIKMPQSGNTKSIAKGKADIFKHIFQISDHFPYLFNIRQKDFIEDRGCQITLSFVGHSAPYETKMAFDPDKEKRKKVLKKVPFKNQKFCCTIAGTTCLDYTFKNGRKGDNIKKLITKMGWNKDDCVYYGDALFKGGNDESVIGVIKTIKVANPKDLLTKL